MQLNLIGTGRYLPQLKLTNAMLARQVDTSDDWITSRTGISERRLTSGEPTWYMAVQAAQRALEAAGLTGSSIDAILVTTCTPDYYFPSTACIVQAELGASRAFCLDLNAACTGFIHGLDLAARYLQDPHIRTILLVASETVSKITDYTDRATCVLFGDGASAVLCTRQGGEGALLATVLGAEGDKARALVSRALPVKHPFLDPAAIWPDRYGQGQGPGLGMDGPDVFKFAVRVLVDAVRQATDKAGVALADLSFVIPHQANQRIVEAAAKRLGLSTQRLVSNLSRYGNTSSASIPLCLDELIQAGQLVRGQLIALCGFGAGLTYGAAVLRY